MSKIMQLASVAANGDDEEAIAMKARRDALAKRLAVVRALLLGDEVGVAKLGIDATDVGTPVDHQAHVASAEALRQLAYEVEGQGFCRELAAPLLGVRAQAPVLADPYGRRLTGELLADVLVLLSDICRAHGVAFRSFAMLTPMQIRLVADGDEYKHGVMACVSQIADLLRSDVYAGERLFDFFSKPAKQRVNRPPHGGRND